MPHPRLWNLESLHHHDLKNQKAATRLHLSHAAVPCILTMRCRHGRRAALPRMAETAPGGYNDPDVQARSVREGDG